jgi:hypothetical protein
MKWIFGLLVATIVFFSCENPVDNYPKQLVGYWVVSSAFRDAQETKLLAEVFFEFDSTQRMLTNLPNTAEGYTEFSLQKEKIVQKAEPPIVYNIVSLTDTSLVLALEMSNTPFEIRLKKASPPSILDIIQTVPQDSTLPQ